jgi:hypothetical protein
MMINIWGKYILCLMQILIFTNLHSPASENKAGSGATEYESYISIKGSSNINNFQLVNQSPNLEKFDIRDLINNAGNSDTYERIQVDVKEFICRNKFLCEDFQELLSASEFPYIYIYIKRRDFPGNQKVGEVFNLQTKITIAGVTRNYTIPCRIVPFDNSGFELTGSKYIALTDFNLNPPKKVFGAIKVNNDVFINFGLRFPVKEISAENSYIEASNVE